MSVAGYGAPSCDAVRHTVVSMQASVAVTQVALL